MGSCIQEEEGSEAPLLSVLGSSMPTGGSTPMEASDGINLIKTGLLSTTNLQGTFIFQLTGPGPRTQHGHCSAFPVIPALHHSREQDGKLTIQTREVTPSPSLHLGKGLQAEVSKLNK